MHRSHRAAAVLSGSLLLAASMAGPAEAASTYPLPRAVKQAMLQGLSFPWAMERFRDETTPLQENPECFAWTWRPGLINGAAANTPGLPKGGHWAVSSRAPVNELPASCNRHGLDRFDYAVWRTPTGWRAMYDYYSSGGDLRPFRVLDARGNVLSG